MKPEITKQLETILDKRQEQKLATADRLSEQQKAEAKNHADFEVTKRNVILPAFQEIIELYKRKGLRIEILEQEEQTNDRGGFWLPNVRLDTAALYPSSYSNMKPEFRLSFQKRDRQVSLYTSTNSSSGPAGNVALDDLTADWIQSEFLKYQAHSY